MIELFAYFLCVILPFAFAVAWFTPTLPPLGIFEREDLGKGPWDYEEWILPLTLPEDIQGLPSVDRAEPTPDYAAAVFYIGKADPMAEAETAVALEMFLDANRARVN